MPRNSDCTRVSVRFQFWMSILKNIVLSKIAETEKREREESTVVVLHSRQTP